ncbi:major facilitator superfamily domain-containing protein 2B [Python bivittatus]|uniref:Major facilitator superfamily domain-containing protein 2B n=1 Tax=Python bivittatus TaxID=176946 RepID=A0A9F5J2U1_PYTBI|nr:major facilitator superfamily domain-containing protein 2B [Python bivittatus]
MAGVGASDPQRGQQDGLPPSPPSQGTGQPSLFQEPEQALGGTAEGLAHEDKLSVCSKLCYGIGGAPNQVASSATSFFLQIYLLDIAQIPPFQASLVQVIGRACGAAADPLAGFFINRSKTTRFGHLMPWLLGCTPFMIVSYILLWYLPPFVSNRILWYLTVYCLFQALSTLYQVPYSALTMFLSTDQADRDSATAFRMAFEVLGTLIGATLQGQIVAGAHTSHCCSQNETIELQQNSSEVLDVSYGRKVYMIAAGLVGGIYLVGILFLFFGVKEKVDPYTLMPAKKVPFFKGQKHAMMHRPYLIFTAAFLLILTAVQIEQGNFVLFCTYAAGLRNHFQNLVLIILVSATASVPFWRRFLKRFGKKKAACGISLMIPSVIMLVTIPNLYLAYFVAFASGLSIAASFLLPWSMLPDVVDHFQLQNPHLPGHETIFYSSFIFFTKMSTGIGMGISSFSLQFVGYKSGMCTQSIYVVITLKILVGGIPSILILLGLSVLLLYPVNEKSQKEMKHAFENSRRIHSSTENFAEESTFAGKPEQK